MSKYLRIERVHLKDETVIENASAALVDGFLVIDGERIDWYNIDQITWLEGVELEQRQQRGKVF